MQLTRRNCSTLRSRHLLTLMPVLDVAPRLDAAQASADLPVIVEVLSTVLDDPFTWYNPQRGAIHVGDSKGTLKETINRSAKQ